jgi:hypothetical protein
MRSIVLTAALIAATPVYAQEEPDSFYVLTKDAGSAKLLLLDSVAGGPTDTSVLVLDVFSSPKTALLETLEFNCPKGTYAVVRKTMVTPDRPATESRARGPSQRVPMGTQMAFVANMVCAGEGNLERDKVIHGKLPEIIRSYWGN